MLSGYRALSRRYVKSFPALSEGVRDRDRAHHPCPGTARAAWRGGDAVWRARRRHRKQAHHLERWLAHHRHDPPPPYAGTAAGVLPDAGAGRAVRVARARRAGDRRISSQTGLVPRFPTAIAAVGFMLGALVCAGGAIILDSVVTGRREAKRLVYLGIPATPSDKGVDCARAANPSRCRVKGAYAQDRSDERQPSANLLLFGDRRRRTASWSTAAIALPAQGRCAAGAVRARALSSRSCTVAVADDLDGQPLAGSSRRQARRPICRSGASSCTYLGAKMILGGVGQCRHRTRHWSRTRSTPIVAEAYRVLFGRRRPAWRRQAWWSTSCWRTSWCLPIPPKSLGRHPPRKRDPDRVSPQQDNCRVYNSCRLLPFQISKACSEGAAAKKSISQLRIPAP